MKWSKTRGANDIAVEAISPGKLGQALATLAKSGVTLCIIDTAGTESTATAAAMKAADLCIIPARPNAFDIWATEATRKALREIRKDFVFLLNQCPPAQQNARVEEGVKALESMGGLISPLIASRVDYQEAARHGYGVSELHPRGPAADEMRKLWSSIKRRMAKAKPAPTRKAA
jgi:chromosome partitioning protein